MKTSNTPAISFDRVGLSIANRQIIDGISFDITKGEFVCVVGPSGCGKTTLLRMVIGLALADKGEVRRFGKPVSGPERDVGLPEQGKKYPAQLSGRMQQRVQIARCLAQKPGILLMDEPFGALDAMTRQSLQDEISAIVAGTGTTVMFVTHDIDEAIYLGDRVVQLDANPGRVAEIIDVNLDRPRNQLSSREAPEFLRLRHVLFEHMERSAHP